MNLFIFLAVILVILSASLWSFGQYVISIDDDSSGIIFQFISVILFVVAFLSIKVGAEKSMAEDTMKYLTNTGIMTLEVNPKTNDTEFKLSPNADSTWKPLCNYLKRK